MGAADGRKVLVNGILLDPANQQSLGKPNGPVELTYVNLGKFHRNPKPLSDADLERFKDLPHLRELNFMGQGIESLRAALPNCKIYWP